MFSDSKYWGYAAERAIKTVAQTAVAVLGTGAVNLLKVDLAGIVAVSLSAGVLSLLTSIANYKKAK